MNLGAMDNLDCSENFSEPSVVRKTFTIISNENKTYVKVTVQHSILWLTEIYFPLYFQWYLIRKAV